MTDNSPVEEWIENPKGIKSDALIYLIYQSYEDGKHWISAGVKFDGCIHLRRAYNHPFPKEDEYQDYIHICDIDDYIKLLLSLKKKAIEHFCEEWPN
mgnify:FL=1